MTFHPDKIGDHGQRYEVRCIDGDGKEMIVGWSEKYPQSLVDAVNATPSWTKPRVIDRNAKTEGGDVSGRNRKM